MDPVFKDVIEGAVIAFVVLFVAMVAAVIRVTVNVRRHERARTLPDGIVNRAAWLETRAGLARERHKISV